jgi:hypothetical protein
MLDCAKNLEFERAAVLRDEIESIGTAPRLIARCCAGSFLLDFEQHQIVQPADELRGL